MKEEKNQEPVAGANAEPIGDAVLHFLAESHPGDEDALEEITGIIEAAGCITDASILELIYKGARHSRDVEAARRDGYLEGRNETIEIESQRRTVALPDDDGDDDCEPDLPLLRHLRRSVWD